MYAAAHACDPVSAFGGVIATNREVTATMAQAIGEVFTEVVLAPSFAPAALEVLTRKKNLRVLVAAPPERAGVELRPVSGGMLAARLGMKPVFFAQAGLLVLAAIATLLLIRNRHRPTGSAAAAPFSPWTFLADRAVWSFFVLAFLPVTACGFFLGFLFPLFAESQGHTTNEISLAFMIFGVGSVYLGPILTRMTSHFFGARRSVPLGALVMAGGLMVFAYFQTLAAAYATIILFGLTESFIFNQGLSYFSSLGSVRRFGEDKAMGVYNVFESSGEALGPVSFGLAMSLGLGVGIASIAATLGICSMLFLALSRSAGKETA